MLAGLAALLCSPFPAAQAASGNEVHYRIQARLDGDVKILTGSETITWRNGSGETVSDAWFHLYLNAFSNNRSTHLTEAQGKLRGHYVEEGWGWSRITGVRAWSTTEAAWVDLMPSFRYEHPDEADGAVSEDRTVFAVDLHEPVPSGGSVELEVRWESQLPRVRRRTGYKDDFLLVAQWFPKLGVYEAGRGWNCHQFHMNTEFFSDYGTYDVELDLPKSYHQKAFGSGDGATTVEGGRAIARFNAPSTRDRTREDAFGRTPVVHDFTWTGSPRYIANTSTFEPSNWIEDYPEQVERARAALGDEALNMRRVDVTTLMHPEHLSQAERHRKATEAALFFYGLWYGEYPYQRITVVDPPWGGRAAGGMEYPTLFTSGSRLFNSPEMHSPEGVTVHEAGHQFWYGLVGNNEFEAAWLDEGLNSFTDSEVMSIVYGPRRSATWYSAIPVWGTRPSSIEPNGGFGELLGLRDVPLPFGLPFEPMRTSGFLDLWRDQPGLTFVEEYSDPRWSDRSGYLSDPDTDPICTWAFLHLDRSSYARNTYPRTAVALRTLQHVVGDAPFLRGMRNVSREWRYRHPYPDDFFRSFQEGAEVECQWYFDEVFKTTWTGDWQLSVDTRRRPEDLGLFQGEGGEFLERPDPSEGGEDVERPWIVEVKLRRDGNLSIPTLLRMTFDDGTTREEVWTREEQLERAWKRIEFESDVKLVAAELDPDGGIFLDEDRSNNAWYADSDDLAPWRFGERVLVQVQHALMFLGSVGG